MAQNSSPNEAGDSEDLQALFDSIAASASPSALPASQPPVASEPDPGGDSDDLQALFDSVAMDFAGTQGQSSVSEASGINVIKPEEADSGNADAVFTRIGHMTRQLHDTLRQLGLDEGLQEVAEVIPDARQRLSYIAQMTEQAASRVLNATDVALPIQEKVGAEAAALQQKWDGVFAGQSSIDQFRALSQETHAFLGDVVVQSRATNAQLMEIMMAQDFQDLTGQVIKKVIEMAQRLENDLLQVLIEVTPAEKRVDMQNNSLMNGPVITAEGREDVVTSQGQVDDLLESLGF